MPVFGLAYLQRRAGGERRRRAASASDGAAPPDGQRDPAGGGDRARRGAERSVPAVVLELERAIDGDRAELAGQGGRRQTRRIADIVRGCCRRARTAAGATRRRTRSRSRRSSPTTAASSRPRRTSPRRRLARQPALSRASSSRGASTDTRRHRHADVEAARLGVAGEHRAAADLHAGRRQGTLFYSARLRYAVDRLFQQGLDQGIRIERALRALCRDRHAAAATTFKAGDLVRVTLTLQLTKERRFVAVTDPLPAGLRAGRILVRHVGERLASSRISRETGGRQLVRLVAARRLRSRRAPRRSRRAVRHATERRPPQFTYVVRATTAGTFRTAPAARRGDVRAGGFRPNGDGGHRGQEVSEQAFTTCGGCWQR